VSQYLYATCLKNPNVIESKGYSNSLFVLYGENMMIKYDQVKDQSTEEYFNNNEFSIDAFNEKYALNDEETYVQALKRVCDYVASVEKTPELRKYWSERWFDEIYEDWWHPAGSSKPCKLHNRIIRFT
jgi:hypothetical protein